ncbi:MAG: acetoin utilization protein AcuC [Thiohalobacteraceae bacterium]
MACCIYRGEALAAYGFGQGHPFGTDRLDAFWANCSSAGLDASLHVCPPVVATDADILRFHTPDYLARVKRQSESGRGYLDAGDTPAFRGVYEAAATVVGSVLDSAARVLAGECRRAFVPIAGLHHARRDGAAGFCVFNDCGVLIETLRAVHGLRRIAYVDIDAHHGDGVFYAFEDDPELIFVDLHEDGRYLYPGTGSAEETGRGAATGTKLNIPLPPNSDDATVLRVWDAAESLLRQTAPEFIILQCGADSVGGDPLTHLSYSRDLHGEIATRLCRLADEYSDGRLVALGGGGYDRANLAAAWTGVVAALCADRQDEIPL